MDIEQTIREERKRRGMSQNDMARVARVAQRTYARYESGKRSMPKAVAELICIKLGLDYDRLS